MDVDSAEYNLSLENSYPDFHPTFKYHGMNCYAYIFANAAPTTFDVVIVQLYESWSRADHALLDLGTREDDYLASWTKRMLDGYAVDFGGDGDAPTLVKVTPSQLVIGLSRGGADGKSAFFWPRNAGKAYNNAAAAQRPRGYAFWNIPLEGQTVNGTNATLSFAPTLNEFLGVRAHGRQP